jgi:hypothetical protein
MVVAAGLLVLGWGLPVRAQPDRSAGDLQSEGLALLKRGEAAAALEHFQRAYALVPSPKVLFNMGRAHALLGNAVDAWDCFDRFLEQASGVPPESRLAALEHRDALRPRIGFLDLQAVGHAEVFIDGRRVDPRWLGRPVPARPGGHLVRLLEHGRLRSEQQIVIRAGETLRVVMLPPPTSSTGSEAGPPSAIAHGETGMGAPARLPPWRRVAAWGSAIASAGALGLALVSERRASARYHDFNGLADTAGSLCSESVPRAGLDPRCGPLLAQGRSARRLAVGSLAAGGLLAVAALILFQAGPAGPDPSPRHAQRATCLPTLLGLGCATRF